MDLESFLSFFVFIFVGSPIALALGGSALIYIVLFANVSPLIVMQQILASVNTYTLLAVPFFIMAGALFLNALFLSAKPLLATLQAV